MTPKGKASTFRPVTSAVLLATSLMMAGCVVAPPPRVAGGNWVAGYYGPAGVWHPGHWVGGGGGPPPEAVEAPVGYGPNRHWVPGFYGPAGGWHPGHWSEG